MMQVIEQTHEDKMKMYMKCTKKKIAEMLIECNRILDAQLQVKNISSNSLVSGELVDFLTWYIHESEFSKDAWSIKLIVDEYLKSTNFR